MNNNYRDLKCQFLVKCGQNLNNSKINKVKVYFQKQINSTRKISKINSLCELITLLEKRDLLDEKNVHILKEIAYLLNHSDYVQLICEYEKQHLNTSQNKNTSLPEPEQFGRNKIENILSVPVSSCNAQSEHFRTPILNMNSSFQQCHMNDIQNTHQPSKENCTTVTNNNHPNAILSGLSTTLNMLFIESFSLSLKLFAMPLGTVSEEEKADKCFELISQEIGHSWKDFSRNLRIREGEIDRIEDKYPKDLKSCCREVFNVIKNKNPRKFRTDLELALRKARRNDLAYQVAEIFDDY